MNFVMDIVLLVTAPSSAIAGLWFWKTPLGHTAWQYFGIVSAIVAILGSSSLRMGNGMMAPFPIRRYYDYAT